MSAPVVVRKLVARLRVMLLTLTLTTTITHPELFVPGAVKGLVVSVETAPPAEMRFTDPQASAAMMPPAAMVWIGGALVTRHWTSGKHDWARAVTIGPPARI